MASGTGVSALECAVWVAAIQRISDGHNLVPRCGCRKRDFGIHFTFVPAGTDASTLSSDGSPPIEAASTMPFDSMPISFAG